MKFDVIAFTARGAALARKITELYPGSEATAPERFCGRALKPFGGSLGGWTEARFQRGGILVFVGASGIAVRAIAPFLRGKSEDAAVLCLDERGRFVIPLLSGHIGGAARAAKELAASLGARAVLTAATDVNGVFAIDNWATRNNCAIKNPSEIKMISAALLSGETVALFTEFPIRGKLPPNVLQVPADSLLAGAPATNGAPQPDRDLQTGDDRPADVSPQANLAKTEAPGSIKAIEITLKTANIFPRSLRLIPRIIVAGIGCRRGASAGQIEKGLREQLSGIGIPVEAVGVIASIDKKADEPGLLELRERLGAKLLIFSAADLMAANGDFSSSERVLRVTGADNVCERAAALARAEIILKKTVLDGVAISIGKLDWHVSFE